MKQRRETTRPTADKDGLGVGVAECAYHCGNNNAKRYYCQGAGVKWRRRTGSNCLPPGLALHGRLDGRTTEKLPTRRGAFRDPFRR